MDSQAPSGDFVDCDFDLPDDVDGALLMKLLDDVVGSDDDNQGRAAEIPGPDDYVDDGAGWVSSGEADHVSIDEWSGPRRRRRRVGSMGRLIGRRWRWDDGDGWGLVRGEFMHGGRV
ncbi:hypothetical protein QJS10_CPB14g00470 [Acorus calamus]|uniref:Uncharacterized protein n=1 Tax=Acorus calamus TaxID=4465 RepID=A0AAV9DBI1_ACOCL|nr:hypothetical protein QJS10_CPB14g00470 [Acorus calamus]